MIELLLWFIALKIAMKVVVILCLFMLIGCAIGGG